MRPTKPGAKWSYLFVVLCILLSIAMLCGCGTTHPSSSSAPPSAPASVKPTNVSGPYTTASELFEAMAACSRSTDIDTLMQSPYLHCVRTGDVVMSDVGPKVNNMACSRTYTFSGDKLQQVIVQFDTSDKSASSTYIRFVGTMHALMEGDVCKEVSVVGDDPIKKDTDLYVENIERGKAKAVATYSDSWGTMYVLSLDASNKEQAIMLQITP